MPTRELPPEDYAHVLGTAFLILLFGSFVCPGLLLLNALLPLPPDLSLGVILLIGMPIGLSSYFFWHAWRRTGRPRLKLGLKGIGYAPPRRPASPWQHDADSEVQWLFQPPSPARSVDPRDVYVSRKHGRTIVYTPTRFFPGNYWMGSLVFTALSLLCLFGLHMGATVTVQCWHTPDGATSCAVTRSLLGATLFHETIDNVREVERKVTFANSGGRSNVEFCRLLLCPIRRLWA